MGKVQGTQAANRAAISGRRAHRSAFQKPSHRKNAGRQPGDMGRREKITVGLDIGSTKVCTLIAAARDSGLEPIGFGIADSKGLKKGVVVNLEATVESIKKSVAEAESMAGCEVDQVFV